MSKKIFEDTYITVQGWMTSVLKLKSNELLAFALIHGFCQDGESEFKGSIAYLMKWLNCSEPTAISTAKKLEAKKLIVKRQEGVNGSIQNRYVVNFETINDLLNNFRTSKKTLVEPLKNFKSASKKPLVTTSKEILDNTLFCISSEELQDKDETLFDQQTTFYTLGSEITEEKSCAKKEIRHVEVQIEGILPVEELRVRNTVQKVEAYFKKWPAMKAVLLDNAKIKEETEAGFNFDDQVENWVRHNVHNLQLCFDPGKQIPKSFQAWLQKFHQFKPKASSNGRQQQISRSNTTANKYGTGETWD